MHFRRQLSTWRRFNNLAILRQFFAGRSTRSDRLVDVDPPQGTKLKKPVRFELRLYSNRDYEVDPKTNGETPVRWYVTEGTTSLEIKFQETVVDQTAKKGNAERTVDMYWTFDRTGQNLTFRMAGKEGTTKGSISRP